MIVYKVTSPSRKVYIGITSQSLEKRRREHIHKASNGGLFKFHKAIRKYGDQLMWEILETFETREEAEFRERQLIEQFDSFKNGYNMTLGGDGWSGGSVESVMSEEAIILRRNRIGNSHKGKKHTEEHKSKISTALMGHKCFYTGIGRGPSPNKGRIMRTSLKERIAKSKGGKSFVSVDRSTGDQKLWHTLPTCMEYFDMKSKGTLWLCLRGSKKSYKNQQFRYVNGSI